MVAPQRNQASRAIRRVSMGTATDGDSMGAMADSRSLRLYRLDSVELATSRRADGRNTNARARSVGRALSRFLMTLQTKVLNLKLEAALALKHAQGWQGLIDRYGEAKATEFYKHLGLNHLETKSIEWEGLMLSREPKEHEKIAVKGIASAQESAKESIGKILLTLRTELIEDGLKGIKKLKPASYHELTLQASSESRSSLRDRLIKVHRQGRMLVVSELAKKEARPEDEFDDLDDLVGVTLSRVVNDTQSRIIASATEGFTLGRTGSDLLLSIQDTLNTGSVSYIDRAAGGLSNRVIGIGRADEMRSRPDDIGRYEYSALLDANTCEPCASLDGATAMNMDDLPEVPLAECDGGSMCRCFIVAVAD